MHRFLFFCRFLNKNRGLALILCLLSLFAPRPGSAQEPQIKTPGAQELYLAGIKSYQNSKFADASAAFRMAHDKDPENRSVLFNWGLSEYKQSHFGMAAATWRRALSLDPDFRAASQALAVIKNQLPAQGSLEEPGFFESFRSAVLVRVSGLQLALTTALLLIISGWLLLKFLGQRRRAQEGEQRLPQFPAIGLTIFLLFLISAFTSLSKVYDFLQPRATVVTASASVYSGPSDTSPSLFELSEGFEVIIKRGEGAWKQITSPGGLSGWVKQESIFQTSGKEQ